MALPEAPSGRLAKPRLLSGQPFPFQDRDNVFSASRGVPQVACDAEALRLLQCFDGLPAADWWRWLALTFPEGNQPVCQTFPCSFLRLFEPVSARMSAL